MDYVLFNRHLTCLLYFLGVELFVKSIRNEKTSLLDWEMMLSAQINYSLHNSNNEVVDYRSMLREVLLSCSLMHNACCTRL